MGALNFTIASVTDEDQDQVVTFGDYSTTGLGRINVVLGKNGCGKSTVLRAMYRKHHRPGNWQLAKYITPERAGQLDYDASVDRAMSQSVGWLGNTRLNNQFNQFKMQTMVLWKQLR
jgi:ABC-type Mn2+/Zn2+ transport system ATPase subunit